MHDQNQSNPRPAELTQSFWQAWREQGKSPRLAHLLLQRGHQLQERFQHFYDQLGKLSRPAQRRWQRKLGASLAGVALTLALSGAPAAHAANFTASDEATLVAAINAANDEGANPGPDTITLTGNVTLTTVNNTRYGPNGLPVITSAITIEGSGFTVARDSGAPTFRILDVASSGNLTLNATTISGGSSVNGSNYIDKFGGGIFNQGTATLTNSTVSSNTASNGGGGILNLFDGTLTLNNSTVSGNSGSKGGGIYNVGTLTLSNSTVSGNTATRGGGINNSQATALTLTNSTVSGNTASNGGGIYNLFGGPLTLVRSLISGNSASSGQEIYNYYGALTAANFNLFGHSGQTNAQAFSNFTPGATDISATSDGTTPTALASILDTALANNGGATLTHALVTGSPAVDAAPTGPATDQRGVSRPQGPAFDIGAYELQAAVTYPFSGFFQPVDNPPTVNTVNAGQGIPVKFSLGGDLGLNIFAANSPNAQPYPCGSGGSSGSDPIEETVTAGSSSLQYDPATQTYTYVWKTSKAWAGTCRQLNVILADGTTHVALFQFNDKGKAAGDDAGAEDTAGQIFLPLISSSGP